MSRDAADHAFALLWRTTSVTPSVAERYRQSPSVEPLLIEVATLRFLGLDDMFWERFLVIPAHDPPHAVLFRREAWSQHEFIPRHLRTGDLLPSCWSAGYMPPRPGPDGLTIILRSLHHDDLPWWRRWFSSR